MVGGSKWLLPFSFTTDQSVMVCHGFMEVIQNPGKVSELLF